MKKEVKIIVAIIIAILVVVIGARVYKTTKSDENKAKQEMNVASKKVTDVSKAKTEKEKYLVQLNNLESTTNSLVNGSIDEQKQAVEKWDNELNKIYNLVNNKLEGNSKTKFEADEQDWQKSRKDSLVEATQPSSKNEINIKMTKERCYYLVNNYMK
ncbi:MAG: lysozyme inhibitor LprI family protein [Clostridium sp.]|uniref:lysozyme inhibitor LprI family protein n=1 Tax=Clostridium sp. TaxID=1506 RepID=UPI003F3F4FA8